MGRYTRGAGIAQSVVWRASCLMWYITAGSTLLWASGRGDFSLELTWVLTPYLKNSFRQEYKLRSSLYTHALHHTDSKDPDIHVLDKNTPSMHHPQRWNVTTSTVGLINSHIHKNSLKMVNPKDIAGNAEEGGRYTHKSRRRKTL